MYAPHAVTLYLAIEDEVDFTTTHYITVLEGVLLDSSKAANIRATGLVSADAANLYIPFSVRAIDGESGAEKHYAEPKEFNKAVDKSMLWTLDERCFFVKGEVVDVEANFQNINKDHDDVYRVTKVDRKDFGSADMQHWEVGGA